MILSPREFLLSLSDMEALDTAGTTRSHPRRMLLSGPKQIGKTGAVFQFLGLVQQFLKQQQEVQVSQRELLVRLPSGTLKYRDLIRKIPRYRQR